MILCILCKCSGDFAGAQKSFFIYCEGSIFLCTSEKFQARDGAQAQLHALNGKACVDAEFPLECGSRSSGSLKSDNGVSHGHPVTAVIGMRRCADCLKYLLPNHTG